MLLIDLLPEEKIIAEAQASHIKSTLLLPQPHPGVLYITNQRVAFAPTQGRLHSEFQYWLDEISSFSIGMLNTINLETKEGNTHKITGMFNKKLIAGLEKVGIKKI